MNYIYDILLNFKEICYDFYEWDVADEITHIRRIPVVRIDSKTLYDLKCSSIKIDNEFLRKYYNKTEAFQKKSIKILDVSIVFTDTKESIACLFKKNEVTGKSRLLLDEDEDLLEVGKTLEEEGFNYELVKKNIVSPFKTKKELVMENYINKALKHINNKDVLKYLYYECFDKKIENNNSIKEIIIENIKNNEKICKKVFDFLKLTAIKK
jgi:hypothetical protein